MSKNITILVVIAVVLIVGFLFYKSSRAPEVAPPDTVSPSADVESGDTAPTPAPPAPPSETSGKEHTVAFASDAFTPKTLTIKKGDTVRWVNNSDRDIWPASAIHPKHRVYPGSDIDKCGKVPAGTIFDACGGVSPDSSWSFEFNEVGEWHYHDHLRSSVTGIIVVE